MFISEGWQVNHDVYHGLIVTAVSDRRFSFGLYYIQNYEYR